MRFAWEQLSEDERKVLHGYAALLGKQTDIKAKLKAAQDDLEAKLDAKYPKLDQRARPCEKLRL